MKFSEILDGLQKCGRIYERTSWNEHSEGKTFIARQIPQQLSTGIVKKMSSLPLDAIDAIVGNPYSDFDLNLLSFHDQVLIIRADYNGSSATQYNPTWEDIFATDWELCEFNK